MKRVFLFFVLLHVTIYRLSRGRIWNKMIGMDVLLLTTRGRKSSQERTTPLVYLRDDKNNYLISASNGGQTTHPGWYFNLQSAPEVTIQIKDRVMKAKVTIAEGETYKQLWSKFTQASPNFSGYEKTANRQIPVVILQPV